MASLKETLKTYSEEISGNSIKELEVAIALDLIEKLPSEKVPAGLTAENARDLSRRKLEKILFFADATEKVEGRVSHIGQKIEAYKDEIKEAEKDEDSEPESN